MEKEEEKEEGVEPKEEEKEEAEEFDVEANDIEFGNEGKLKDMDAVFTSLEVHTEDPS